MICKGCLGLFPATGWNSRRGLRAHQSPSFIPSLRIKRAIPPLPFCLNDFIISPFLHSADNGSRGSIVGNATSYG